jgi:hypothetical protein
MTFSCRYCCVEVTSRLISYMRQLVEIQRAYLELQAKPYRLDYAGEW